MKTLRIFHPVGQGAYYTEVHENTAGDSVFTVVFDCGSSTFTGKKLEALVGAAFAKNHQIDILFLSHFHADHINGIDYLKKKYKIKNVVLPLLDDEAKVLQKVSNFLDSGITDTQLIDEPESYFGNDTTIIEVEAVENPGENSEGITGEGEQVSDYNGRRKVSIPSGKMLMADKAAAIDWLFIPFNYKYKSRKEMFVAELQKLGLDLSQIDTIEKISAHKADIRKAYDKVKGDLNENSLLLFSGNADSKVIWSVVNNRYNPFYYDRVYRNCIYFGDINLNATGIVEDIKTKLKIFLPTTGTMQVPHHGAIGNFNRGILEDAGFTCAIQSFGINNSYGHPSSTVVGELVRNNVFSFSVTEEPDSRLIQFSNQDEEMFNMVE